MVIFVDTSGLLALLDRDEPRHAIASDTWIGWIEQGFPLWTTNYVLIETSALARNRLGMEAAQILHRNLVPLLNVQWVDPDLHHAAVTTFIASNRRQLSLVDCTSFVVMRRLGIEIAFVFDHHFAEQGFTILPIVEES